MSDKPEIPPLKRRTMSLDELQRETLAVIEKMRKQLTRQSWQGGMTDEEFISEVLSPLTIRIRQDRLILKSSENEACPHAHPHVYCDGCKVSPCPIGLDDKSEEPQ